MAARQKLNDTRDHVMLMKLACSIRPAPCHAVEQKTESGKYVVVEYRIPISMPITCSVHRDPDPNLEVGSQTG
jgi:hypothetical protein